MIHAMISFVASSLLCAGVTPNTSAPESARQLVATTAMVGDVVSSVAGDKAQVKVLMGEGVDPHLYKPRSSDVRAILSADGTFYNGMYLEGRMADVLGKAATRGKEVVAVAEVIPAEKRLNAEDDGAHEDPHVWMDVALWATTAPSVAEALCRIDPEHCQEYRARAEAYGKELRELDAYVRELIATIPPQQRVLITAHDAFGYFGRAYGLQVRGIQGISTESEAGLADINRLVNFIVVNNIPAVFVESSVAVKNVNALLEGAKAQGHALQIGGELFSDAMGQPGTWEGTYPGMIDHNATTITRALGGKAPQGGYRAWKAQRRVKSAPSP